MSERERSEPFDVSEQFRMSNNNLESFKDFLNSIKGADVILDLDISDIPDQMAFLNMLSYGRAEQFRKVRIRATKQEQEKNPRLFITNPVIEWVEK